MLFSNTKDPEWTQHRKEVTAIGFYQLRPCSSLLLYCNGLFTLFGVYYDVF